MDAKNHLYGKDEKTFIILLLSGIIFALHLIILTLYKPWFKTEYLQMMIVLLFSIAVTMLCCYSVSLMLATKEKNTHNNIYITLYHKDNTALRKPLTIHTPQSSFAQKSKLNTHFTKTDNVYPIMPHNKYYLPQLDIKV